MDEGTLAITIMSLLIFLSFLGFMIWGIKTGQFKYTEKEKYQILKNGEEKDNNKAGPVVTNAEEGGGEV
jgi:nitrogen fixation-related uncharacterized protein